MTMTDQPFDWTQATGRWRRIGLKFREECRAICSGVTAALPVRDQSVPSPFAQELRAARIRRGWSQKDVGRAAGCSDANICLIEKGKTLPRPELRARIQAFIEG